MQLMSSDPPSTTPMPSAPPAVVGMEEHPIFRRSRKALGSGEYSPIAPDTSPPAMAQAPAPEPPVLVGILRGTNGQVWALVEAPGNTGRHLVSQGGEAFGWSIREIGVKHIVVRHRESGTDLRLRLPGSYDAEPTSSAGSQPG